MICIVTVYKSLNSGSFLQAQALRNTLLEFDNDVCLLDGKFRSWIPNAQIRRILGCLKRLNFKEVVFIVRRLINNYKQWNQLPHISLKEANSRQDITFIFGSDEIWNVGRKYCEIPEFWGIGLKGRKIAYAPSINNTTIEQLQDALHYVNGLKEFSAISVRDKYSQSTLSTFLKRDVPIVLDPTLLHSVEYYKQTSYKKFNFRYIAIYAFSLRPNDLSNIKRFARENNLKTVMLSELNNNFDYSFSMDITNPFLYYFDADYIITDTFHGTAFAINFQKPFISLVRNNNKVKNLLSLFGLTDSIATDLPYDDFKQKLLSNQTFLENASHNLDKLREDSLNYIKDALNNKYDTAR